MDIDDIAIERIAVEDLREDRSGVLIGQIASLAYRASESRLGTTTSKGRACTLDSASI
ncbi:MAG: hypothetical protein M3461_23970 [Pseudomonadota bacterium]|nr:hypothetical protein [Pseudomonadota bacterium]